MLLAAGRPPLLLACSIIPKGLKVQALNIFSKDGRDMTPCVGVAEAFQLGLKRTILSRNLVFHKII
jgi:hypothetical protein